MSFRDLITDLKTYPVTLAFCVAWVVVFVAMVGTLGSDGSTQPWRWSRLMIGMTNGQQFGDLTIRDFRHGEVWRLLTCTFVHYGLVHLGLNLLAMYQLGAIVENWYGSYQMILIYALTGGLGNLVSVLARIALGYEENVHSGGGSVVILGLVGLCAVVGWRSRTRRGVYLGQQMISVMVLTAILGMGFPLFFKGVGVDNWGHTGGAIIGGLVALGHNRLIRNIGRPRACELGLLSLLVILGCGFAQAASERGQAKIRSEGAVRLKMQIHDQTFQIIKAVKTLVASPDQATTVNLLLERVEEALDRPETGKPYREMRLLAAKAKQGALSAEEVAVFQADAAAVERVVRTEYQQALDEFWIVRKKRSERTNPGR